MPTPTPYLLLILLSSLSFLPAHAHDVNGMDMSMDGSMQLSTGQMLNYLHFPSYSSGNGDTLWFNGWVTTSPSSVGGACIGLFLLAIGERCVAGVEGVVGRAWARR